MKNSIVFIFVILSLFGCRNYNSEEYINIENKAIKDIIPQITELKKISEMNNYDIENLKLYLISTLDTCIFEISETKEEHIIPLNSVDLSENKISRNKSQNLKEIEKTKNEKELFADLKNGKIKKRKLDYKFKYPNLKIELISKNTNIDNTDLAKNELGYLQLTRIIFNSNFTKGYLSYTFFCGLGCAWGYNIEIMNINGEWKVTKTYSGIIA